MIERCYLCFGFALIVTTALIIAAEIVPNSCFDSSGIASSLSSTRYLGGSSFSASAIISSLQRSQSQHENLLSAVSSLSFTQCS